MSALLAVFLLASASLPATAAPRAETAAGCSADDFDGDGHDDVVVGDPLADAAGVRGAGAVHVVSADGGKGIVLTPPDPQEGEAFGWAVRATHYDGDACLDVVVGAPYEDGGGRADAGAVYVFHGGHTPPEVTRISPPHPERNAHFGWSLAAAPAGARPAVLAVGAPYEDADGTTDAGALYIYCADARGEPGTPKRVTQDAEGVVGNSEEGDMFGWSLVFGRLGGRADSVDLVIGTPYENDDGVGKQGGSAGKPDTGAVEVIYDIAEQGNTYTSVNWGIPESVRDVPEHPGDRYGYALAYAEFRGKPYLAASAPLADAGGAADSGLVEIFQPDSAGKVRPVRTIRLGAEGLDGPAEAGAGLGWSLAMVGSDKDLCLAIGSPLDSRSGAEAGVIREVFLSGDHGERRLQLQEPRPHDHFGWSVAAYGATAPYGPGTGLVAGVPDDTAAPGGAVALLREGRQTALLVPGRDGVPAVPQGSSADFGAAVSG